MKLCIPYLGHAAQRTNFLFSVRRDPYMGHTFEQFIIIVIELMHSQFNKIILSSSETKNHVLSLKFWISLVKTYHKIKQKLLFRAA